MTKKQAKIKEDYLKNSDVVFSEYLRNRIAKGLEISDNKSGTFLSGLEMKNSSL